MLSPGQLYGIIQSVTCKSHEPSLKFLPNGSAVVTLLCQLSQWSLQTHPFTTFRGPENHRLVWTTSGFHLSLANGEHQLDSGGMENEVGVTSLPVLSLQGCQKRAVSLPKRRPASWVPE